MTPDTAEWHDAARDMPRMTRRELLAERADLHPDDVRPPAEHLRPAPGVDPLTAFARSVELAREGARERGAA